MARTEVELIRDRKIVSADFSAGAVDEAALGTDAVTTTKIKDKSVTASKLADSINFFPSGGIVLWSGVVSNIPSGWVLCDGQNSTPDLRGKFIIGAGGSYNPSATGGAETVTLTTAQLPSHSHNTGSAGSHGHTTSTSGGSHSHSGSTSGAGGHNHGVNDPGHKHRWGVDDNIGAVGPNNPDANPGSNYRDTTNDRTGININGVGDHAHNFNTSSASADHSHNVGSNGSHTHTGGATGSGGSHDNMPPYYALCYIMKT